MTSDDGSSNATVEELAALAEDPREDVAGVTATETEVETEEVSEETTEVETTEETANTNALSDTELILVDKYGKMDDSERVEKIEKMLTSGRKDQVASAKMLMESFDLEIETANSTTDDAVAESLRKMGLTPESIKDLQERKELVDREDAAKVWAKTLGTTPSAILKNKDFVKAYHRADGDVQEKVDAAMKAYLEKNPVADATKKKATLKLSTTENTGDSPKKKTEKSLEDLLGGKSLEDIDLSEL